MNPFWLVLALVGSASQPSQPVLVQFARGVTGRNVTVCIDGEQVETTFAGKLGFRDANTSWVSICADVRSPIANGQFFGVRPLRSSKLGGNISLAGNIVAKYFKTAQTPDQCAGLQVAVWEALEDGGERPNFSDGRFQVHASAAVLAYAVSYYQTIDEPGDALYLQVNSGGGGGQGGGDGQGGTQSGGGQGSGSGGGQNQFGG